MPQLPLRVKGPAFIRIGECLIKHLPLAAQTNLEVGAFDDTHLEVIAEAWYQRQCPVGRLEGVE